MHIGYIGDSFPYLILSWKECKHSWDLSDQSFTDLSSLPVTTSSESGLPGKWWSDMAKLSRTKDLIHRDAEYWPKASLAHVICMPSEGAQKLPTWQAPHLRKAGKVSETYPCYFGVCSTFADLSSELVIKCLPLDPNSTERTAPVCPFRVTDSPLLNCPKCGDSSLKQSNAPSKWSLHLTY